MSRDGHPEWCHLMPGHHACAITEMVRATERAEKAEAEADNLERLATLHLAERDKALAMLRICGADMATLAEWWFPETRRSVAAMLAKYTEVTP